MLLKELLELWPNDDSFNQIAAGINSSSKYIANATGMDGSARAYFMAALAAFTGRKTVIITPDLARAEKTYSVLESFLPGEVNMLQPREFFLSPEVVTRSDEQQRQRLRYINWAIGEKNGIYVGPASAFISKALPPQIWKSLIIKIEVGRKFDRQELIDHLIVRGYERSTLAEKPGQFSARGDIVDIYSPGLSAPIRLELFDDQIESLRSYDPETQRTTGKLLKTAVAPSRELIITEEVYKKGKDLILNKLEKALSGLRRRGETDAAVKLSQTVNRHLERLKEPEGLDLLNFYLPFFYGAGSSLLDYLDPGCLVIMEEPADIAEKGRLLGKEIADFNTGSIIDGDLLGSGESLYWREEEFTEHIACPLVGCSLLAGSGGLFLAAISKSFNTKAAPVYHGRFDLLQKEYQQWRHEGFKVCLLAATEERARGLKLLLREQQSDPATESDAASPVRDSDYAGMATVTGNIEEGFVIPELKVVLIAEQNLVPRRKKQRRYSREEGVKLSNYRDLAAGDYVVHEHHGIGLYQGLHTLEVGGVKRDYLLLKYRGTDKLYLPIDQVGLIQKYSGGDGPSPRLHNLGGGEWQRLKSRVNRSVEELARELLALYAARKTVEGYSFGPDQAWQQDFEANFPFEETPDQQNAIAAVKADLEKSHPMDRLICGDVGYGKTEVAMRAAFKVVMEGKQVAILVPTTVLAQQHYRTFCERFAGFPVKVAQLSRFVPASRQKEIIKEVAAGKIDIVIGTHRLLSKDIKFHDLGLLVLDEEQRFGVKQKEKMRQMRLEVDTLAMTATPIPRTLHLSLAGARDLSIIDTPPENRYPVQTYVMEYSEQLVAEAVQRELNRQGQVFIVYNRVERINAFSEKIQKLFPDADIAVGHGQLPERVLERVMSDFQGGLYQILISSTIIESGLDIPNVNTLIVCEADRFGLAQLYQIRGRVGRSSRLAYAYLTYRKDKIVSETARKRLRAIKEFTELGSGFKIALRDLEIRGAGNILGAEQHGFIAAVGFDLYVKLLDQAVAELKNEKRDVRVNPRLELEVSAYLPASYINAQDQKIDFYQRIYNASSREELKEIEAELIDRYASPPQPVQALLHAARIRIMARDLNIELIRQHKNTLVIQFVHSTVPDRDLLKTAVMPKGARLKIVSRQPLMLEVKLPLHQVMALDELARLISSLLPVDTEAAGSNRIP
jgi:transcription-repair coupling factor (superfamily II helicase)